MRWWQSLAFLSCLTVGIHFFHNGIMHGETIWITAIAGGVLLAIFTNIIGDTIYRSKKNYNKIEDIEKKLAEIVTSLGSFRTISLKINKDNTKHINEVDKKVDIINNKLDKLKDI